MYIYNAKCVRVVDGDTIDATIDLGFDTWKKIRIRLVGMNAPESRTRDLAFLKDILGKHDNDFILHSQGVGKYGRCLGNLFLGEKNVNDLMISEGHAVEYQGGKR